MLMMMIIMMHISFALCVQAHSEHFALRDLFYEKLEPYVRMHYHDAIDGNRPTSACTIPDIQFYCQCELMMLNRFTVLRANRQLRTHSPNAIRWPTQTHTHTHIHFAVKTGRALTFTFTQHY